MSFAQLAASVLYYRSRPSGQRLIFRSSEIRDVEATPMGAIITTHTGCEYKVDSPKPDQIVLETQAAK